MAELEQRLGSLKEEFSELEDGFERYSYLMELGGYLPPYPEEKEPPTIWCGDVKVRYGFTATPKTGAFSSTQTAIHISLRVCFCSCRICSRIFRCRRPQMQIWSLYRSWDWKMSFRIPGKRVSVLRLQCSQMRQKRIAHHLAPTAYLRSLRYYKSAGNHCTSTVSGVFSALCSPFCIPTVPHLSFVTMCELHPIRLAKDSIAKQNLSHRANVICNGSPHGFSGFF